jgi:hypothetical protein
MIRRQFSFSVAASGVGGMAVAIIFVIELMNKRGIHDSSLLL